MAANFFYTRSLSRNINLITSRLSVTPLFALLIFILCVGNIGAPPSPNLLAEIIIIAHIYSFNWHSFIPLAVAAGLATAFSLNLFIATCHSQLSDYYKRWTPLSSYELTTIASHTWPVIVGALWALAIIYCNINKSCRAQRLNCWASNSGFFAVIRKNFL